MNDLSPTTESAPEKVQKTSRRSWVWFYWLVALTLLAAGFSLFIYPKAKQHWKKQEVDKLMAAAQAHWDQEEFNLVTPLLTKAFAKDPRDPRVQRMIAQSYDQSPTGTGAALHFWKELRRNGHATWDDQIALGQAHLRLAELKPAREIADSLPADVRAQLKAMEFQAALLAAEGKTAEAEAQMRQAWSAHPEDLESRARLACVNLKSPFSEISEQAVQTLWEVARQDHAAALTALFGLSSVGSLSTSNWREIASLIGKRRAKNQVQRKAILNACLKNVPELLPDIIKREKELLPVNEPEVRAAFYQWIAEQNQPDIILQELPEPEVMRSRGLFLAYADALMRKGRWDDLQRLVSRSDHPLTPVDSELIAAFTARGRQESAENVKRHLQTAELRALSSRKAADLFQVAAAAENMSEPEIAVNLYTMLADDKDRRPDMLKRVIDLQQQRFDTTAVLKATESLLIERPDLPHYKDLGIYLRLITGSKMEEAIEKLHAASGSPVTPLEQLNRALAADLTGDTRQVRETATQITPSDLQPGQRGVLAYLLQASGKLAESASIMEQLGNATMLPEEKSFVDLVEQ
jgi:tetratricopeptide (TPR) repeat protein